MDSFLSTVKNGLNAIFKFLGGLWDSVTHWFSDLASSFSTGGATGLATDAAFGKGNGAVDAALDATLGRGDGPGQLSGHDLNPVRVAREIQETGKLNDQMDGMIRDAGRPGRHKVPERLDDGKPSIYGFNHLATALLDVSPDMNDMHLSAKPERGQNNKIKLSEIAKRKFDMRDPRNIAEFEHALDLNISREAKAVETGEPGAIGKITSLGLDKGDTSAKYNLSSLKAAKAELEMYKADVKEYKAKHPNEPFTTQPVG
jgi:hypothetical protein